MVFDGTVITGIALAGIIFCLAGTFKFIKQYKRRYPYLICLLCVLFLLLYLRDLSVINLGVTYQSLEELVEREGYGEVLHTAEGEESVCIVTKTADGSESHIIIKTSDGYKVGNWKTIVLKTVGRFSLTLTTDPSNSDHYLEVHAVVSDQDWSVQDNCGSNFTWTKEDAGNHYYFILGLTRIKTFNSGYELLLNYDGETYILNNKLRPLVSDTIGKTVEFCGGADFENYLRARRGRNIIWKISNRPSLIC